LIGQFKHGSHWPKNISQEASSLDNYFIINVIGPNTKNIRNQFMQPSYWSLAIFEHFLLDKLSVYWAILLVRKPQSEHDRTIMLSCDWLIMFWQKYYWLNYSYYYVSFYKSFMLYFFVILLGIKYHFII
jgi:hypothetical protein